MKTMRFIASSMVVASLVVGGTLEAAPLGTAFTYQGRLKSVGQPANGTFHLRFQLWNDLEGGSQMGSDVNFPTVTVADGSFTVSPDFGSSPFDGSARWLQVQVITNGGATVTTLAPRQPVSAAPYSLRSQETRGIAVDNSDNVGVGTTTPGSKLHIASPSIGPWDSHIQFGPTGDWYVRSAVSTGKVVLQDTGGNVGIGTTAPISRLHIASHNIGPYDSHVQFGETGDWYIRSAASAGKVILQDTGGNVGIGTTTPVSALQVANGDLTFKDIGGFTGGRAEIRTAGDLIFKKNIDSPTNDSSWFRWYTEADTIENMRINNGDEATIYGDGSFNSNGIDYAEAFKVKQSDLESGDVVRVAIGDWEYASRTATGYDPHIVGVVSTKPGFVTGMSFDAEDAADPVIRAKRDAARSAGNKALERNLTQQLNQLVQHTHRPIALIGRVPCKVDAAFGAIKAGDRLTSSPTPGHAMKQMKAGPSVGIALQGLDSGTGKVMILVQPGWFGGNLQSSAPIADQEQIIRALSERISRLESRLSAQTGYSETAP